MAGPKDLLQEWPLKMGVAGGSFFVLSSVCQGGQDRIDG